MPSSPATQHRSFLWLVRWLDSRRSDALTASVDDERFDRDVALGGSLGAAESYLQDRWTCDDLTTLLRIFARDLQVADEMERGARTLTAPISRLAHRLRRSSVRGSRRNIHAHYDLGNDFFWLFLDETMTYSCGIFTDRRCSMRQASLAKIDRICRKLDLHRHDHVLEIGTGWGGFALHAAGEYGCKVTTTTISRRQHELAARRVREAGLSDRIELLTADYRALRGRYDKLVSIEMIEAVGHEFLETFFRHCTRLLADDGLMAIQAIVMPDHRHEAYRRSVDFIRRYVFPGSCLPSIAAMTAAMSRGSDLRLVHLEDITPHYVTTLQHWRQRFRENLPAIRRLGYPPRLVHLWMYYLAYCEAGFAERSIGDVQMVLARPRCRRDAVVPPLPATAGEVRR